ncbi:DUF6133 family protein [Bacteroides heparinolyticus]|uniref:DUF6133 family protein n=1 Tax=Prevotella heparinolytica TaxID=28113 RepID=UPI00359FFEB5
MKMKNKAKQILKGLREQFNMFMKDECGEAFIGEAVKIVIVIVIGALLIAGLTALWNSAIFPAIKTWVETWFGNAKPGGVFLWNLR